MKPFKTKEGYQVYGCKHTHKGMIVMNSSPLALSSYLMWKDDTGFDGNKSECFDCYLKRIKNEEKTKNNR